MMEGFIGEVDVATTATARKPAPKARVTKAPARTRTVKTGTITRKRAPRTAAPKRDESWRGDMAPTSAFLDGADIPAFLNGLPADWVARRARTRAAVILACGAASVLALSGTLLLLIR